MLSSTSATSGPAPLLDPLDRISIAYLTLPLAIFLVGWFHWWVALPLLGCTAYALRPLLAGRWSMVNRVPVTRLQFGVALVVGCSWTLFGGADHIAFANADWHIRDAVL